MTSNAKKSTIFILTSVKMSSGGVVGNPHSCLFIHRTKGDKQHLFIFYGYRSPFLQ